MTVIAQLTDLHICAPGELAYGEVDTMVHLIAAVDHLNRLSPDAIVITGDLTDHGTAEEYAHLRPVLDRLAAPWWPIPGNHDGLLFWEVFADRMIEPARGIGHIADLADLRLVLLDTSVAGAAHGEVTPDRAAWLIEALNCERSTLLALHHPPFETGIGHMDRIGMDGIDRLTDAIRAAPPLAILCGHIHRTILGSIAGVPAFVSPSCAHAVALDLAPDGPARFAMEPPGVGLHLVQDGRLVSHVSHIGTFDGPYPFAGFAY